MPHILVLYYTRYGANAEMAHHVARGVETIAGMEAKIRTVPAIAPITESAKAPTAHTETAPFVTHADLTECTGLILGGPTRFGNMAAPLKHFWDTTTPLWLSGALIGKPAGVFSSSGSLHGGQETTLITMMIPLLHHGMLLVGLPYSEPDLVTTTTGGTPYGPTHVAGSNSKNPVTDEEKRLCQALGKRVADVAKKLQ